MPYQPIQCGLYDYIELACLRHYALEIKFQDGENLIGRAETIRIINREEFLVFDVNGRKQQIRLDKIKSITVLDDNAEFGMIELN